MTPPAAGTVQPLPLRIVRSAPPIATLPPLGSNLRVLLVWPKFPPSFWGFEGVLDMVQEGAITPPLGLITVAAVCPPTWDLRLLARSIWTQGLRSGYRRAYRGFLATLVRRYRKDEVKMWMGFSLLLSAHHFLIYSRQVADELERNCTAALAEARTADVPAQLSRAG